jgi:hypothetical protein
MNDLKFTNTGNKRKPSGYHQGQDYSDRYVEYDGFTGHLEHHTSDNKWTAFVGGGNTLKNWDLPKLVGEYDDLKEAKKAVIAHMKKKIKIK